MSGSAGSCRGREEADSHRGVRATGADSYLECRRNEAVEDCWTEMSARTDRHSIRTSGYWALDWESGSGEYARAMTGRRR